MKKHPDLASPVAVLVVVLLAVAVDTGQAASVHVGQVHQAWVGVVVVATLVVLLLVVPGGSLCILLIVTIHGQGDCKP